MGKYIASVSFGKDSLAMLLYILENKLPLDEVVFYDTGMEFQAIYDVRNKVLPILQDAGVTYTELHPKPLLYTICCTALWFRNKKAHITVTGGAAVFAVGVRLGKHKRLINISATAWNFTIYDEILTTAAEVLSNNPEQEVFTPEVVDGLMDIEDMALLLREYALFAGGLTKAPN